MWLSILTLPVSFWRWWLRWWSSIVSTLPFLQYCASGNYCLYKYCESLRTSILFTSNSTYCKRGNCSAFTLHVAETTAVGQKSLEPFIYWWFNNVFYSNFMQLNSTTSCHRCTTRCTNIVKVFPSQQFPEWTLDEFQGWVNSLAVNSGHEQWEENNRLFQRCCCNCRLNAITFWGWQYIFDVVLFNSVYANNLTGLHSAVQPVIHYLSELMHWSLLRERQYTFFGRG